jgi:hypothetical protein
MITLIWAFEWWWLLQVVFLATRGVDLQNGRSQDFFRRHDGLIRYLPFSWWYLVLPSLSL